MKSNFLIFIFLFTVFYSLDAEPHAGKKGFLLNVNGIPIYKAKDITQKMGVLNHKDAFSVIENENEEDWTEIVQENKTVFIRKSKSISEEILLFEIPIQKNFLVTQRVNAQIFEKPFLDAKSVGQLKMFSILEILSYSEPFENKKESIEERWFEVKAKNKTVGYVKDISFFYDSLDKANAVAKKKQVHLNGYALVSNPVYLAEVGGKELETNKRGFSKKGEFIRVKKSQEINGVRYFYTSMSNPSLRYKMQARPEKFQDKPFAGWISEKDAKYFTFTEFSQFTLKNSKSKVDKDILYKIFAQNEYLPIDYTNVNLNSVGKQNKNELSMFSIVSLFLGYVNSSSYGEIEPKNFVVKKETGDYTVFAGSLSNRGKFELFDLDRDGIPEIYSSMDTDSMSRIAFAAPVFYGFVNGAYVAIPLPGNFLDNYSIDGKFLYLNERNGIDNKVNQKKYKYHKGKFVEIKN